MYQPNFTRTDRIVNLITEISASREIILNASLLPRWLEYFTEGVAVSMAKIKETIVDFSLDKRLKDKKGQIFLNDRQMRILKYLQTNPRITNRVCRKLMGLSDEGVRKELNFLIQNEFIKAKGSGRGTHYVLVGD